MPEYSRKLTRVALAGAVLMIAEASSTAAGSWFSDCGPHLGWWRIPDPRGALSAGSGIYSRVAPGGPTTIDKDHNGVVSEEEAADHAEFVFGLTDWNEDGLITLEEFLSTRPGPGFRLDIARERVILDMKEANFRSMDANGDGLVQKAEFLNAARERFLASDSDGNGQVTPWEFRASRWWFRN